MMKILKHSHEPCAVYCSVTEVIEDLVSVIEVIEDLIEDDLRIPASERNEDNRKIRRPEEWRRELRRPEAWRRELLSERRLARSVI